MASQARGSNQDMPCPPKPLTSPRPDDLALEYPSVLPHQTCEASPAVSRSEEDCINHSERWTSGAQWSAYDMPNGSSPVPDAASSVQSVKSSKSSKSNKSDDLGVIGLIEADADETADDSAFGEDFESSTHSIHSSILRYREENGRTYHAYKDGKYVMPNDELEQERLDLQHHLFLITFDDRLYLSPAGKNGHQMHHVLDVGTGTGLWALDFADAHPEAKVIGVDLSPIQTDFVPSNLHYQVDDLEDTWEFSESFDFIYSRMMTVSFANWPRFFKQAYDNLSPGGWLELADICPVTSDDGTLKDDMFMARWGTQLLEGTRMIGRPFDGAFQYKEQMEAQGFQNVTQLVYKWPQNRWPKNRRLKELGTWTLENISTGLEGLSAAVYTRVLGWTKEDLDVFLSQVRQDLRNPNIHAYWPIYVVYGQKPMQAK